MADTTEPRDADPSDRPVHERHLAMRRWMLPVLGVLFILNLAAFLQQLPARFGGHAVMTTSHPAICTVETVDHIVHVLPHARNAEDERATRHRRDIGLAPLTGTP